jgi:hypothetical protein
VLFGKLGFQSTDGRRECPMNAWVAAGATAALMSERGRSLLRRGLVYAAAGAMNAGEALASGATEVAHGAERVASSAGDLAGGLVGEAQ